jgi:hypothetical protein
MKKYLQACEIGGSIYGKHRGNPKKRTAGAQRNNREDAVASYHAFYKSQVDALYKVFRRDG